MPEDWTSLGPLLGTRDRPGTGDLDWERPLKGTLTSHFPSAMVPYFSALG